MEKASWKPIPAQPDQPAILKRLNLLMAAKQPPSYDGKVSWFRYEELVDDWTTFTTIEASKQEPLLKSRLIGDAYMYKAGLRNDRFARS